MKEQEWTDAVDKAGDAIVKLIQRNREDTSKKAPFGKDVVRVR